MNVTDTTTTCHPSRPWARAAWILVSLACAALAAPPLSMSTTAAQNAPVRTFATPEDAVQALIGTVKAGKLDDLVALFGPGGQELVEGSDPATARSNRQVFTVAAAEGWRIVDQGPARKTLIVGYEAWPFPVPLVQEGTGWRFDAEAGKEEVIGRRIGRNELAVIEVCRAYVTAQHVYAEQGHDGKPAGLYAKTFHSEPGRQNGLYWAVARGQKRSPFGDLVAQAAEEGRSLDTSGSQPSTFHGYHFRILAAQGPAATGGAKSYVVSGEMSAGFALVAWPARYDVTGVMTFIINQEGLLHEKDLGEQTDNLARSMTRYNPDRSWRKVPQQAD
jgi:hypothetical protein